MLSPLPTIFARRHSDDLSSTSALKEFCYFVTTGIVLSAFMLPIVLARADAGNGQGVVRWMASCQSQQDSKPLCFNVKDSKI